MSGRSIVCIFISGTALICALLLTAAVLLERKAVGRREKLITLLFAWVLFQFANYFISAGVIRIQLGNALRGEAGLGPDGRYYLHRTDANPLHVPERTYRLVYTYQLLTILCHALTMFIVGPLLIYLWLKRRGLTEVPPG